MRTSSLVIALLVFSTSPAQPVRTTASVGVVGLDRFIELGQIAAKDKTLHMVLLGEFMPGKTLDTVPIHTEVSLVWWQKEGPGLRIDSAKGDKLECALRLAKDSFTWQRKGQSVPGAYRWEPERLSISAGLDPKLGTPGFFLDATQGYAGLLSQFTVEALPGLNEEKLEWFRFESRTDRKTKLPSLVFQASVDVETGLFMELQMTAGGHMVIMRALSVDVNGPVGDALQIPSAVQAAGIIEAHSGLPWK